jgi:alkanesulfonate monooxygenase SsuD/methylene tetrahydromethanopterin reductase-like flavin-dependent oxidoreductase (luciferase family)
VVPASDQPPEFYAQLARRVWEECRGNFVLGIGSGQMTHASREMVPYIETLRRLLPPDLPVYLAALGPRMLGLGGELADGIALNWCSADQVAWSRAEVALAASRAGRPTPPIAEYIRTSVDSDPDIAARVLGVAMLGYALGPSAYRRHFERMGFAAELAGKESAQSEPGQVLLSAVGACGAPGEVRQKFLDLAQGLDCAIVRVLVSQPGDAESARRVLEECRPG